MALDHPPIPMSADEEFSFPSEVYENITYILKAYSRKHVVNTIVTQRLITAKRRPLTERMRDIMLEADLKPYLSVADVSKLYETLKALQAGASGMPEEDLIFVNQVVEPIMIENFPEYEALYMRDEALAYERRIHDLCDTLYAVEEKGNRYTFPEDDHKGKFAYVMAHVDVLDANLLYVNSRNLAKLSADAAKNSEPPSTSD